MNSNLTVQSTFGPLVEGSVAYCGYWRKWYFVHGFETVRDITFILVQWEDGEFGSHCTAWNERDGDAIIMQPGFIDAAIQWASVCPQAFLPVQCVTLEVSEVA